MNEAPIPTCRFCAEPIQAAAKICPHCRQWLTYRSFRNPLILFQFHSIPLLALYFLLLPSMLDRMNPGPYYAEFPDSLQVASSRLTWLQTSNVYRMYFTGILTNHSQVAWKDIQFECRFFDHNGSMVDAVHPSSFFMIQSCDDAAFSFTVKPSLPTNEYASYKISVNSAHNGKAMF